MRRISLKVLPKLQDNFDTEVSSRYEENKEEYREMWSKQTLKFWVKFVVKLRESFFCSTGLKDEDMDNFFVSFLKALSSDTYEELHEFVHDVLYARLESMETVHFLDEESMQVHIDKMSQPVRRCFSCVYVCVFLSLLSVWKNAEEGDDFDFTPPEAWFQSDAVASPLEQYIQDQWGNRSDINDILGCKKEEVTWWRNIVSGSKELQDTIKHQSEISSASGSKEPQDTIMHQSEGNTALESQEICPSVKSREITRASSQEELHSLLSPELPWLFHRIETFTNCTKKVKKVRQKEGPHLTIHALLEHAFPPFLDSKYHNVSADSFLNSHSLSVAPWFTLWISAFGHQYLKRIIEHSKEIEKISTKKGPKNRGKASWYQECNTDIKIMKDLREKIGAPDVERDSIPQSDKFLLEPGVLVQLPWQPVLLRQWLLLALAEVLRAESSVVEFKYLPMSKELATVATDIVKLVYFVKRRILIGFVVLYILDTRKIERCKCPLKIKNLPKFLWEKVLHPVMKGLEFMCSGKLAAIALDLKLHMNLNNKSISDQYIISENCYYVSWSLRDFFRQMFIKFMFSCHKISNFETGLDVETFCLNREVKHCEEAKTKDCSLKTFTFRRDYLYCSHLYIPKKEDNDEFDISKLNSWFIEDLCSHQTRFTLPCLKVMADLLEQPREKLTDDEKALLHWYKDATKNFYAVDQFLSSTQDDTSVLASVSRLAILKCCRENQFQAIAACASIVKSCPRLCVDQEQQEPVLKMEEIVEVMEQVHTCGDRNDVEDEATLSSQIVPLAWKEPVGKKLSMPGPKDGIKAVIEALETRIGKIVWNAFCNNFIKYENGEDLFPFAQVVQYIIPCYISHLSKIQGKFRKQLEANLIKFLTALVKHYEKSYTAWLAGKSVHHHNTVKLGGEKYKTARVLAAYMCDVASNILHVFAGLSVEQDSQLNIVFEVFREFPKCGTNREFSQLDLLKCEAWLNVAFPHIKVVYELCVKKIPIPSDLQCPELEQLYFLDTLTHVLEVMCAVQDLKFNGNKTKHHTVMQGVQESLGPWRHSLYLALFDVTHDPESFHISPEFVSRGRDLLLHVFVVLMNARRHMKELELRQFRLDMFVPSLSYFHWVLFRHFIKGSTQYVKQFYEDSDKLQAELTSIKNTYKCGKCGVREPKPDTFIMCDKCKGSQYPRPQLYCSQKCKSSSWTEEHEVEHMEFELGLM